MTSIISCFIIFIISFCFLFSQEIIDSQNVLSSIGDMAELMVDDHASGMNMTEGNSDEKLISPITEWIGIFSLGIVAGLFIFKTNRGNRFDKQDRKTRPRDLIIAIAILSASAGIIHLLLVPEHSQESWVWGVIFLASGLAQIGFGIVIFLVRECALRNTLYYVGIIGNSILVITFILVRLTPPPFSSEEIPINELEPNGIITLIIEIVLVVLLIYQLKFKDNTKEHLPQI